MTRESAGARTTRVAGPRTIVPGFATLAGELGTAFQAFFSGSLIGSATGHGAELPSPARLVCESSLAVKADAIHASDYGTYRAKEM